MERSEQLKWCESCKLRKPTLESGLICGVTGRIAEFEETCPVFEIDTKAFQDNFRQSFQNDKIPRFRELRGEVNSTSKIHWRKYSSAKQLPVVFEIRNSWYGGRAMLLALIGALLIGVKLPFFSERLWLMIPPFVQIIYLLIIPLLIILTIREALDRKPKITLTSSGIKLDKGRLLPWEKTATVIAESRRGVLLFIKPFNQAKIEIQLQALEYGPERIGHLVEMYKEKGRATGF